MGKLLKVALAAGVIGLIGAAVWKEIRRPREERQWHGRVGGFVPYDFRPPSLDRVRHAVWNPEDERVVTDTPFGMGWYLNVGRLARIARTRRAA